MKILSNKILVLIFIIIPFQLILSQNIEKIKGKWLGTLKLPAIELRVVFNVSESEDGSLKTTFDSPDQGAYGIAVDSTIYDYPNVRFVILAAKGFYEGKFDQDSIIGKWTQGMPLPLTLKKTKKLEEFQRPQQPKPPYPYNEEEVSYPNEKAGLTLAGTFTYPKEGNSFPAVVLISGSGAQNRNEELFGHKPFLVLADYLTRNGIAVLRFDDRGTAKSTGDFSSATTKDFVSDALASVEYLRSRKEINKNEIGLIGHSEGGLIAPLAAVESPDVDFIVLMAGTGIIGKELLKKQTARILKANGYDEEKIKRDINVLSQMYEVIVTEKDTSVAREKLKEVFDKNYAVLTDEEKKEIGEPNQFFNNQTKILLSSWFRFFLKYDPYPALTKVKVPVLAINGEKDLQVPPKEDLEMIEKALKEGGNKNYKVIEFPGLNHLFQTAETGSPAEYSKIEETIAPVVLETITGWIKEIVK